jgi:hypothetical protein
MSQPETLDWEDTQRLEGWAGETRLNLIRLLAIAVFYGRHVIEAMTAAPDSPVRGVYHIRVTCICILWAALAIMLHAKLRQRWMPPGLKYFTTGFDAAMITLLCVLAGGPKAPLLMLYFPLIATAPMRVSLRLVYFATSCAILGYLIVLAIYAWYVIGFKKYYSTPELRIPRSQEAFFILALAVSGVMAGQVVRQMRRIAGRYPVVVAEEQ